MEIFLHPRNNSMEKCNYGITLAGEKLTIGFQYKKTVAFFCRFLDPCETDEEAVSVPKEEIQSYAEKWQIDNKAYIEYILCAFYCCDELLRRQCCIFHGAAFLWRGKAFLFTARSGGGKTTQLINWLLMCGEEIEILNGDKPVLRSEGGTITVNPSPWKGKERFGNDMLTARLAGIIYLEQADEDSVRRLVPEEAIEPILRRVLSTFGTQEIVLNACSFCDSLLSAVPVWCLANRGSIESALLMRDTLLREVFTDEI